MPSLYDPRSAGEPKASGSAVYGSAVYGSAGQVYGAGRCVRIFSLFFFPSLLRVQQVASCLAGSISRHPGRPRPVQVSGVFRGIPGELRSRRGVGGPSLQRLPEETSWTSPPAAVVPALEVAGLSAFWAPPGPACAGRAVSGSRLQLVARG